MKKLENIMYMMGGVAAGGALMYFLNTKEGKNMIQDVTGFLTKYKCDCGCLKCGK